MAILTFSQTVPLLLWRFFYNFYFYFACYYTYKIMVHAITVEYRVIIKTVYRAACTLYNLYGENVLCATCALNILYRYCSFCGMNLQKQFMSLFCFLSHFLIHQTFYIKTTQTFSRFLLHRENGQETETQIQLSYRRRNSNLPLNHSPPLAVGSGPIFGDQEARV